MSLQHFLKDNDLDQQQLTSLIATAIDIKAQTKNYQNQLSGKSIAMLFEKPSLRTHVSFDVGIAKLGGHSVYLGQQNGLLGERERICDLAQNLSCWCDAIVARVFYQSALNELAAHATVPVINALSDDYHPCQALADYMALTQTFGTLKGLNLCFVGDGNNVAQSLLIMGALLGVNVTIITPEGYQVDPVIAQQSAIISAQSGSRIVFSNDLAAAQNQQVIYTDTWLSMGDKEAIEQRLDIFMPYQVNSDLVKHANAEVVMHCQPAHVEQEISRRVFESAQCIAMLQAQNRMWAQSALLTNLLT
ncbi:ornithine carbamoyltransferase [Thalassotalea ponticola]|uniref:ornithine carbamoyltransferase n=1 Tax=Thalassotalea ponticola TaxID=1523392 RepID=UPI0025B5AC84|nr:ornithine carbamoyltransferase [Thalassotalea ponticola]MDN3652859.1 ornithine carbamoyltransferase [Thalassotalea ponticola]